MIPNCIPTISGNELKYLTEAVNTGWLSSVGPYVDRFESDFAEYHGVSSATAVSSGTAAIHLGLKVLGVQPGDLVLCPTLTFVGTTNPIKYCGADPVFLDVEENTLNIDPKCLDNFLSTAAVSSEGSVYHSSSGRRIAALMIVHLYGNPAEMNELMDIARKYKLPVIEDAAESLGACYEGKLVGTIGDIGCFSFNGNKVITTGGGGMLIASNPERAKLAKHLSTQAKSDSFEFIHDQIGYNYRLSNLCAAVGVAQMEKLDEFIARKRHHAKTYVDALTTSRNLSIVQDFDDRNGTYWMILAKMSESNDLIKRLKAWARNGVGVRPIWYPLHKLPMYRQELFYGNGQAERLYNSVFCLPSSVGLTDDEIKQVVDAIDC